MAVVEHRFRVMASEARLVLVDPTPNAVAVAAARLEELEQRWSRFLSDSDVSRLARADGSACPVAPETHWLLRTMVQAHHLTGGRYDPTMLREIVAAGYRTSVDDQARTSVTIDLPHPVATVDTVAFDGCNVTLVEGMAVDPGGIGKGLAADLVATELLTLGVAGALVNVGGDLSAVGRSPGPEGWRVNVEDPLSHGGNLIAVAIDAGGVATSSTLSRSWQHGRHRRHHQLDPRTGTSSGTDLAAVTVFAPSAWEAEVHATAALLEGSRGAVAYLEGHGLSGIAVTLAGACLPTHRLATAGIERVEVAAS